jgi:hypothetical protein
MDPLHKNTVRLLGEKDVEIARLRAVILNIQAMAERGLPIDAGKLATRCRKALAHLP